MFATLHDLPRRPDGPALAALRDRPDLSAAWCLDAVTGPSCVIVALWADAESAAAGADAYPTPPDAAPAEPLEVESDWPFRSAGAEPRAASVLWFDGPISPEGRAAARFAGEQRVLPALTEQCPGLVRALTLWAPTHRATVTVGFAVSLEAMAGNRAVVQGTTLLPGEDPALLPGPDRGGTYQVTEALAAAPGVAS